MSLYYKQNFVSAEPLFSEVKEELRSYFASSAIDDLMFPKWVEHCLRRFRKAAYKINHVTLLVKDYQACLPADFNAVREAWLSTTFHTWPYQEANSVYEVEKCVVEDLSLTKCDECFESQNCQNTNEIITKTIGIHRYTYKRTHLLRPGNIDTKKRCGEHCPNTHSESIYSFDIQNGNLVITQCEGIIDLLYYADPSLEGEQLVPDDFWVQDYIRKFIIYKCFCQLSNTIVDETYNQIERKKQEADKIQAEAFILAETNLKKQTVEEKMRQIRVSYNQNNKYRLPR